MEGHSSRTDHVGSLLRPRSLIETFLRWIGVLARKERRL